jgi:hypothetical protein
MTLTSVILLRGLVLKPNIVVPSCHLSIVRHTAAKRPLLDQLFQANPLRT